VLASNLMAMLVQTLSAKLGIATGRNLAEVCRDEFPAPGVVRPLAQAEVIAMATDLAEVLGAALGSACCSGSRSAGARDRRRAAFRSSPSGLRLPPLEAVIAVFVGVIVRASRRAVSGHARPRRWPTTLLAAFERRGACCASGIVGATVMPHVIYLHSA
jgi:manganese transport protein